MNSLIFSSAKAALDELGAVKVITQNLLVNDPCTFDGTIIGSGIYTKDCQKNSKLKQIDIRQDLLHESLLYRIATKLCRQYFNDTSFAKKIIAFSNERVGVLADKLVAKRIKSAFYNKPNANLLLGFSGMSLASGKAAKSINKRYIIHAQWAHPYVQNNSVAEAYKSLDLVPPIVSKAQVARQIEEFDLADKIWCPSEFVKESLIANGVTKEKLFVAYLGVDIMKFRVSEENRQSSNIFMILFVGNVGIQKGIHVLLKALEIGNLSNIIMLFNGQADSAALSLIKEYTPVLEKKNITIRIDPGDPRRYHRQASVFVLPSVHDAYGIVVPEAMAAGLPIIISDQAGAKEIVAHGKNGFVFPSSDSQKLSEYLEYLHQNPEKRRIFGRLSETMAEQYDIEYTSNKILSMLDRK